MPPHYLRTILLLSAISVCCSSASAQLFGDTDISRNRKRKSVDSAAVVTGSEKFVRGNRTAGDFVGAAAAGEATFVGAALAPTTAVALGSVAGLVEEAAPRVNVPRTRTVAGIYAERLTVAFEPLANEGIRLPFRTTLSEPLSQIATNRGFEVTLSPMDSSVLLRGTVESPRQKRIAELLVLFEPGIGTVTNELRVEPKRSR